MRQLTGPPQPGHRPPDPRPTSLDEVLRELRVIKGEVADVKQAVMCLPTVESGVRDLKDRFNRRTKTHLTVEEVAEITGRAPYTVRRWIKEKRIRAQRIKDGGPKGRLLIQREEIERLIADGLGAEVPDAVLA
jgi:excisionase family DNA binding protein